MARTSQGSSEAVSFDSFVSASRASSEHEPNETEGSSEEEVQELSGPMTRHRTRQLLASSQRKRPLKSVERTLSEVREGLRGFSRDDPMDFDEQAEQASEQPEFLPTRRAILPLATGPGAEDLRIGSSDEFRTPFAPPKNEEKRNQKAKSLGKASKRAQKPSTRPRVPQKSIPRSEEGEHEPIFLRESPSPSVIQPPPGRGADADVSSVDARIRAALAQSEALAEFRRSADVRAVEDRMRGLKEDLMGCLQKTVDQIATKVDQLSGPSAPKSKSVKVRTDNNASRVAGNRPKAAAHPSSDS
eukprot:gene22534-9015_t